MDQSKTTKAHRIAQAASTCQQRRTGRVPDSVTVVLSDDTLVITLHGALSPAEQALAKTPAGAAQVQEFHRQLFATGSDPLRREIQEITGVAVKEAAAEIEPAAGAVLQVFTTGTVVQMFRLARHLPAESWGGTLGGAGS
jgi:uncharacterized protein YbcI